MREVQGAICVASIFQLVIGYTGLLGLLLKFISPLTIGPSVAMIGLSLFDVASLNYRKSTAYQTLKKGHNSRDEEYG